MDIKATARANMQSLRSNEYPGRGIVIGQTPNGERLVQVYWIMGRSENSRNRVFVRDGDLVRTAPFDESKVEDPSLIIYNCIRKLQHTHIVSNGDQTDTIHEGLRNSRSFEESLYTRTFEPDAPNYTPRIAGVIDLNDSTHAYKLAILKTLDGVETRPARHIFNFGNFIPGIGHYIATYDGNGDPLPSFSGEPRALPLGDDIDEVLTTYWQALDPDNKVSLLVKFIDPDSNESDIRIANKNK